MVLITSYNFIACSFLDGHKLDVGKTRDGARGSAKAGKT